MQPVQVGMNSVVVLLMLLLAVPLQLFLSHYISTAYAVTTSSGADSAKAGTDGVTGDIHSFRAEAMHRLKVGISSVVNFINSTFQYYSKWENVKKLFVVPYKKGRFNAEKYTSGSKSDSKVFLDRTDKFGQAESSSLKSKNKASPPPKSSPETSSNTNKAEKSLTSQEDEDYLYTEVYFARSKTPRVNRPPQAKLKVGQVVKHRTDGYYGVIVGWDEVARAPEKWLKRYYSKRHHVIDSPNYLVLVDSRYISTSDPFHYIPQEDLQVVEENFRIQAPEVNRYFEGFKNHRHLPRPWLKELYPSDS